MSEKFITEVLQRVMEYLDREQCNHPGKIYIILIE